MPSNPAHLRENGNFFGSIRAGFGGSFMSVEGRGNGNLPIYILPYAAVLGKFTAEIAKQWRSVISNPDTHTQPTFHRDDDLNLPDAPPAEGYPELHIAGNGMPYPAFLRPVVDLG